VCQTCAPERDDGSELACTPVGIERVERPDGSVEITDEVPPPESLDEAPTPEPEPGVMSRWTGFIQKHLIDTAKREDATTDKALDLLARQNERLLRMQERSARFWKLVLVAIICVILAILVAALGLGTGSITLPFGLGSIETGPAHEAPPPPGKE